MGIVSLRTTGSLPEARPRRNADARQRTHSDYDNLKVGIICNARARRNLDPQVQFLKGVRSAMPRTHAEMHDVLASFAEHGTDVIVVDGGDGTIRDVIGDALQHFGARMPPLAIVPSGKTNALAADLGIPRQWTMQSALHAIRAGNIAERAPIDILRPGSACPDQRGFLLGTGAFVRATALAQHAHRIGAFNDVAVAMSIAGGVAQTAFGRADNAWRRGERLVMQGQGGSETASSNYMMMATTLRKLPTAVRPFGPERSGLKVLRIDAPPRRIFRNLPLLLTGSESPRLARDGYHRCDLKQMRLHLQSEFILDGERYPGGDLLIREGAPLRFVVP